MLPNSIELRDENILRLRLDSTKKKSGIGTNTKSQDKRHDQIMRFIGTSELTPWVCLEESTP